MFKTTKNFKKDSINDLIKLYRSCDNNILKDKIFKHILTGKRTGSNSNHNWHENILIHLGKYRITFSDYDVTIQDIYQEILIDLKGAIENKFDINLCISFSTYAWKLIQNRANREVQKLKSDKYIKSCTKIKVHDQYKGNKLYNEVISDNNNYGILKTIEKNNGFERILFYKNIIEILKKSFRAEENEIPEDLNNKLINIVKNKKNNQNVLITLSIAYSKSLEEIEKFKDIVEKNLENELFLDIMNLLDDGIKDASILADKYGRSQAYICKMKKKFRKICKKEIDNLGISNIFAS